MDPGARLTGVKGLVVGRGSIGDRHLSILNRVYPDGPHVQVGSREFSGLLSLGNRSDSLPETMRAVDFGIVASPAPDHLRHASSLIRAGKPVLVEKPISAHMEEAVALEMLAGKLNGVVQVGYVLRHSPAFQRFRQLVHRLKVRPLHQVTIRAHSYLPDWRSGRDYREGVSARAQLGGGALLELSHEIDYCQDLFGPLNLYKATLSTSPELEVDVETSALLVGTTEGGVQVSISLDMANRNLERWCEVRGEGGSAKWDIGSGTVTSHFEGESESVDRLGDDRDEWFRSQLVAFMDSVHHQKPVAVPVSDAVAVLRTIEAARQLGGGDA